MNGNLGESSLEILPTQRLIFQTLYWSRNIIFVNFNFLSTIKYPNKCSFQNLVCVFCDKSMWKISNTVITCAFIIRLSHIKYGTQEKWSDRPQSSTNHPSADSITLIKSPEPKFTIFISTWPIIYGWQSCSSSTFASPTSSSKDTQSFNQCSKIWCDPR